MGGTVALQQGGGQPPDHHRRVAEHARQFGAQVAQGLLASIMPVGTREQFGHRPPSHSFPNPRSSSITGFVQSQARGRWSKVS